MLACLIYYFKEKIMLEEVRIKVKFLACQQIIFHSNFSK